MEDLFDLGTEIGGSKSSRAGKQTGSPRGSHSGGDRERWVWSPRLLAGAKLVGSFVVGFFLARVESGGFWESALEDSSLLGS